MKKFLISTHGFDMGIGGLKVLHKLCHLLNERGQDAYLIPLHFDWPFAVYEGYNVKMVTQEILDNLDDVIVVYPESWFGNYLNAPNVVRWMIGFPSDDHIKTWNDNDLWFWYLPFYITEKYKQKNPDNFLYVGEQHREIFYDYKQPRTGSCWTLRKSQDTVLTSQYIHPADSTFIPYNAAGDLVGLSRLFNLKERFYCYDNYTYLSIQSLMCNTDTIVIPINKTKEQFLSGFELNKYIAYGVDDLSRAKSIRNEFFDHLDLMEKRTIDQIDLFVEKCYGYFK
jgi:hypothetical protein